MQDEEDDLLRERDNDMFQVVFPDLCSHHQEIPAICFRRAALVSSMCAYLTTSVRNTNITTAGTQLIMLIDLIKEYLAEATYDLDNLDALVNNFVEQLDPDTLYNQFILLQSFLEDNPVGNDSLVINIHEYLACSDLSEFEFHDIQDKFISQFDRLDDFKIILKDITRKILNYVSDLYFQGHVTNGFLNIDFFNFFLMQGVTAYNFKRYTEYDILRKDFPRSQIRRPDNSEVKKFLLLICLTYNALFYGCRISEQDYQTNFSNILAWYLIGNQLEEILITERERIEDCPQAPLNNFLHYIMNAQNLPEDELDARIRILGLVQRFEIPVSDFSLDSIKVFNKNKDVINQICSIVTESYEIHLARGANPNLTDRNDEIQLGEIICALYRKFYLLIYTSQTYGSLIHKLNDKRIHVTDNLIAKRRIMIVLKSHIKNICATCHNSQSYSSEFLRQIFDHNDIAIRNADEATLLELIERDIRLHYQTQSILPKINTSPAHPRITEQELIDTIFCLEYCLAEKKFEPNCVENLQLILTSLWPDIKPYTIRYVFEHFDELADNPKLIFCWSDLSNFYCTLTMQSCFAKLTECIIAFILLTSPLILIWRINLITMISSICASGLSFLISLAFVIFFAVKKHQISKCNYETYDSSSKPIYHQQEQLTNEILETPKEI
jgi:hypothetical protein